MAGDEFVGVRRRELPRAVQVLSLVVVEHLRQHLRTAPSGQGWPVIRASPATRTRPITYEQWPAVCPGVGMAFGCPGSVAATSGVRAWVPGMPSRTMPPLATASSDHFSQLGRQAWDSTTSGETCWRYSRLAWPTSSAWQ